MFGIVPLFLGLSQNNPNEKESFLRGRREENKDILNINSLKINANV